MSAALGLPDDTPFKPDFAAWYGLLQVATRLAERISAVLEARTGLPLAWFEVLMQLHWSDAGRRRMSELADALLLLRGGTTRMVARVEAAGLVRREVPPDDRRATYAVLTDAGRRAAEAALPVHGELVHATYHAFLDERDVHTLVRVFNRVLQANAWPCRPVTEAAARLESRSEAA